MDRDVQKDLRRLFFFSLSRIEEDGAQAARAIRRQVPDYQSVTPDEHDSFVTEQLASLLAGLADSRAPSDEDLQRARTLGGRRALQGLPLESVMLAYHIGYQYLWSRLLDRARVRGADVAMALLATVDAMWTWVERVTTAAASGSAEALRREQEDRLEAGHRFMENLFSGRAADKSTALLARSLGLDPHADFIAIAIPLTAESQAHRAGLEKASRQMQIAAFVYVGADAVVLLAQAPTTRAHDLIGALGVPPDGVGVSMSRSGLTGLAHALRNAHEAMALAVHTQVTSIDYESAWWALALNDRRQEILPLISSGVSAASPHLADAVLAYTSNGFSVTAAGQALHVHPNTVKYRLDRWRQQTGWDVRSVDGLQRSLAHLALAPWDAESLGSGRDVP